MHTNTYSQNPELIPRTLLKKTKDLKSKDVN